MFPGRLVLNGAGDDDDDDDEKSCAGKSVFCSCTVMIRMYTCVYIYSDKQVQNGKRKSFIVMSTFERQRVDALRSVPSGFQSYRMLRPGSELGWLIPLTCRQGRVAGNSREPEAGRPSP